ncbi:50S ribosomal protein L25/general stress protein Ctc [Parapusillimonas granuli]|uniref:Large ribosomal subunit protein bL25 n=1 Tax=Parapusillimonas granuli TaxID=380911 RepID=A0A853FZM8_9BURK|nr:50S ribosomal protein L25/general stress protein Ctc [Parapusillimonas granuli]MBB5215230.1 large subunit ribosomal protein L25 [Parapusillimonas granuli]MEB2398435.1 50S ribosomal protein L25/general stress protein Ctc [Alcaligenaceae bacterium]NYT49547.1 50S ribosomal protein L25/general stress protein Ctc [Parapusillimonas granuli]
MKFNATTRSDKGTSASRRLRRAGRVPAIVYGGNADPLSIELDHNEIFHALRKEEFHASILDMQLDGKGQQVLLRAVQWHPYKPQVLHVDFQRVDAKQAITTKVPLHFLNGDISPAVKTHGQLISHVMTELEVTCLPADLPQAIEVDLSQLGAGGNVYLSDITLPQGVTHIVHGAEGDLVLAAALSKPGAGAEDAAEGAAEGSE